MVGLDIRYATYKSFDSPHCVNTSTMKSDWLNVRVLVGAPQHWPFHNTTKCGRRLPAGTKEGKSKWKYLDS
jgi:hypothetical protein